ncbi:hypothetical protein PR048_023659 [Dryococelus australis]|uniref:Uncharacterized protein n=1 Tax=Dryococelus australis TaxID=614101 RepID=A0ABQ9GUQ9_9NEOP|nr:hypothetical protein PR048_023659 [Dryococelus australis]
MANVVGKFGFIPIVTYDQSKNHGLNHLVMEDVLSLKLRPMDAEIGTTYHWTWMTGTKSSEEPHTGWCGFMEIASGKGSYEKAAMIPLPFVNLHLLTPPQLTPVFISRLKKARSGNKIRDIVSQADKTDELSKVIVRLGEFHLLMSYMGEVVKIMGGSVMGELSGELFSKNASITSSFTVSGSYRSFDFGVEKDFLSVLTTKISGEFTRCYICPPTKNIFKPKSSTLKTLEERRNKS